MNYQGGNVIRNLLGRRKLLYAIGLCNGRSQGRGAETSIICFLATLFLPATSFQDLKSLKVVSEMILSKADDKDENTQGPVSVIGCGGCL